SPTRCFCKSFLRLLPLLAGKSVFVNCPPERNLGDPCACIRKRLFFSCNSLNKYLTYAVHSKEALHVKYGGVGGSGGWDEHSPGYGAGGVAGRAAGNIGRRMRRRVRMRAAGRRRGSGKRRI